MDDFKWKLFIYLFNTLYKLICCYFIANGMWTGCGRKAEDYHLGLKIQLTGIIKKDCISNRTALMYKEDQFC